MRGVKKKAPPGFEPGISCLLDRRFNQLSHGAAACVSQNLIIYSVCNWISAMDSIDCTSTILLI